MFHHAGGETPEQVAVERLWNLHSWRYSELDWTWLPELPDLVGPALCKSLD